MKALTVKYLAIVLLAFMVAMLLAVPVFGRTAPVSVVGAGDIAYCISTNDEATAQLLGGTLRRLTADGKLPPLHQARVITMGDNVQGSGLRSEFATCYDNYRLSDGRIFDRSRPAWWGKYKKRTMPALGNHEYYNSSEPRLRSRPYFDYLRARNGFKLPRSPVPNTRNSPGLTLGKGYYSYDLGSWHIVVLNSNDHCAYVSCSGRSAQARWLRQDLAANPRACTLAYIHHPLYATGTGGRAPEVKPLWRILYNHGAEVMLNGHNHRYERLAPIDPDGNLDSARGIRSITVGTGGVPGGGTSATPPISSQVRIFGTSGVIRMDLGSGSYRWRFIAVDGTPKGTVMDSGTASCH